ncbi:hypothetical protein AGLY_009868, partial [Aphis glycines]
SLKTINGVPLWKSQRKTFIIGFATSIKSIINISKDLLVNHGFKFVLTYKFSQDAIELFFGHMRGGFGSNNNPNCLQFTNAIKSILLHTSITLVNGNCNLLTHEDSLFSIKWKYKRPFMDQEDEEESTIKLLIDNISNEPFINTITDNVICILLYFLLYSKKKLIPVLQYPNDIKAINQIQKKVLKKVCNTRWEARHSSVYALKENFINVLKFLTNISLTSKKSDELNRAKSLLKKMQSFEFVLLIIIWENVLKPLSVVSKMLQCSQTSIHQASEFLQIGINSIKNMRHNYKELVELAKNMCLKWGIQFHNENKRKIYFKKRFGEVDDRFKGLKIVSNTFNFLLPPNIIKLNESEIVKSCYGFIQFYKTDVTSDLTSQVLSLKEFIKNTDMKTIKELFLYLIENDLSSLYSEVVTCCIIFLSLPVTVASAKRSFSKLKLIKNYLRNSISQDQLTNIRGLQLASESVFKIVKLTEQYFKCIIINKNKLFIKKYGSKNNDSDKTNKCFEDTEMHSHPHKINIINLVSRIYLNIRIHSYSKILSSSIMKSSVNKRQKLH